MLIGEKVRSQGFSECQPSDLSANYHELIFPSTFHKNIDTLKHFVKSSRPGLEPGMLVLQIESSTTKLPRIVYNKAL